MPLYLVATPIGNLGDLSLRAVETLAQADLVAAEDTRRTRALLAHLDLKKRLVACHEHNEEQMICRLLPELQEGRRVALVSDAGSPAISDPGERLVRAAAAAGIPVIPIPGPSAVIAAVTASGLAPLPFTFAGFLPRRGRERSSAIASLKPLPHTLVLFEAANRLSETLGDLEASLGDRPAVVAREITKLHEEFHRGSLAQLKEQFRERPARGECVLVVAGAPPLEEEGEGALRQQVGRLLSAGYSPAETVRILTLLGCGRKNRVYEMAVALSGDSDSGESESD